MKIVFNKDDSNFSVEKSAKHGFFDKHPLGIIEAWFRFRCFLVSVDRSIPVYDDRLRLNRQKSTDCFSGFYNNLYFSFFRPPPLSTGGGGGGKSHFPKITEKRC